MGDRLWTATGTGKILSITTMVIVVKIISGWLRKQSIGSSYRNTCFQLNENQPGTVRVRKEID
ncbi:MAG: hypothetical protein ACU0C9_02275 [Paracoccaceae bacterium]